MGKLRTAKRPKSRALVPPGFQGRISMCIREADRILAVPPARAWIPRTEGVGELVARFVLPLALCPTGNASRHAPPWKAARIKAAAFARMVAQHKRRSSPLPGRPMVRAIRFSSKAPDRFSDFAKIPIDVLCAPTATVQRRLGFFRDDNQEALEVAQWWEPRGAGDGFVLLEVWTGDPDWGQS